MMLNTAVIKDLQFHW